MHIVSGLWRCFEKPASEISASTQHNELMEGYRKLLTLQIFKGHFSIIISTTSKRLVS